ncbi:MAG: hypothetical protein IRY99_17390, partial [Isosphaeraceae bacterium]|nr:hypothetical protein [Isosphaeraceae bacterium]
AGAFGGVGGSSAFGTKAGDVFTRITIVVACIWFLLSMLLVVLNNRPRQSAFQSAPASASEVPVPGGSAAGKGTPTDKGAEKGPGVPTPSPSATQPGPADTQQGKSSSGIPEVFPSESSSKSKSAPAPVKTP